MRNQASNYSRRDMRRQTPSRGNSYVRRPQGSMRKRAWDENFEDGVASFEYNTSGDEHALIYQEESEIWIESVYDESGRLVWDNNFQSFNSVEEAKAKAMELMYPGGGGW